MNSTIEKAWVHVDDGTHFCDNINPGTFAVPVDVNTDQVECKNCGMLLVEQRVLDACRAAGIPTRYAPQAALILRYANR